MLPWVRVIYERHLYLVTKGSGGWLTKHQIHWLYANGRTDLWHHSLIVCIHHFINAIKVSIENNMNWCSIPSSNDNLQWRSATLYIQIGQWSLTFSPWASFTSGQQVSCTEIWTLAMFHTVRLIWLLCKKRAHCYWMVWYNYVES